MAQDWYYFQFEAARAFHYTLREWETETPRVRARVIAHYMEKNMREGYAMEKAKMAGEGKGLTPPELPDWSKFRQGGGER